jgi:ClpP class serine protease
LIDEIGTSDDFLRQAAQHSDLYHLSYKRPKRFVERLMQGAEGLLSR